MSIRKSERDCHEEKSGGRFGDLLRSLMAGIPWSESAEGQELFTLESPAKNAIHIHNANGRTEVVGEDRDDIEVVACKQARAESSRAAEEMIAAMKVRGEIVGGELEVEVDIPRKWNRHGRVSLLVRLPDSLQLSVTSSNGRVCVHRMQAPVTAHSSNGSVLIEDVIGDVRITTANAKVRCLRTHGELVARSSNGKLELSEHEGPVDASTSNGSICASLQKVVRDGVMLATSNGRIVLELPEEVDAEMDIRVDNGLIRNDRCITTSGSELAGRVRGRLGRGGPLIKLRTSNGTISVR